MSSRRARLGRDNWLHDLPATHLEYLFSALEVPEEKIERIRARWRGQAATDTASSSMVSNAVTWMENRLISRSRWGEEIEAEWGQQRGWGLKSDRPARARAGNWVADQRRGLQPKQVRCQVCSQCPHCGGTAMVDANKMFPFIEEDLTT